MQKCWFTAHRWVGGNWCVSNSEEEQTLNQCISSYCICSSCSSIAQCEKIKTCRKHQTCALWNAQMNMHVVEQKHVLNTLASGWFWRFSQKNSSFRLPYQRPSSSTDCARELFNSSKGSASLVDCTRKKNFAWGVRVFCALQPAQRRARR